jgi:hypothetical protein
MSVAKEKESDEVAIVGVDEVEKVGPAGLKIVRNGKSSVRNVHILVLHEVSGELVDEKK